MKSYNLVNGTSCLRDTAPMIEITELLVRSKANVAVAVNDLLSSTIFTSKKRYTWTWPKVMVLSVALIVPLKVLLLDDIVP